MDGQDADIRAAAARLHAFAVRAGALRAVLLLDNGPDCPAAIVDATPGEPVEVELETGAGTELVSDLPGDPPGVPLVTAVDPFEVDEESGEVTARVGRLEAIAEAIRTLGDGFGGASVVTVELPTTTDVTLAIAARAGEPLLLVIGERQFAAPPGWPEPSA